MVDSTPEPMLLARDADRSLIKVLLITMCGQSPADPDSGKALAELQCPLWHGLMADKNNLVAVSTSSTIRRLKGIKKYSHTVWLMS